MTDWICKTPFIMFFMQLVTIMQSNQIISSKLSKLLGKLAVVQFPYSIFSQVPIPRHCLHFRPIRWFSFQSFIFFSPFIISVSDWINCCAWASLKYLMDLIPYILVRLPLCPSSCKGYIMNLIINIYTFSSNYLL